MYCRALAACLRDAGTIERLDIGSQVTLTHLRNEVIFEGSLSLQEQLGEVQTIFGEGKLSVTEPAKVPLSQII